MGSGQATTGLILSRTVTVKEQLVDPLEFVAVTDTVVTPLLNALVIESDAPAAPLPLPVVAPEMCK
jgi:hypothetical protein